MKGAETQRHIIPDGKPLMKRRDVIRLGISRDTILKMEENGIIRRIFPHPGSHGYYAREEIKRVIERANAGEAAPHCADAKRPRSTGSSVSEPAAGEE